MKKGFTLVEVMVAMACSIIVMSTVGGTVFFISQITDKTISDCSLNYKATKVKDYILNGSLNDHKLVETIKDEIYDSYINDGSGLTSYILDNPLHWTYGIDSPLKYDSEEILESFDLTSISYELEIKNVSPIDVYIYYCTLTYQKSYGEESLKFIVAIENKQHTA